jgi:hypothetical protein
MEVLDEALMRASTLRAMSFHNLPTATISMGEVLCDLMAIAFCGFGRRRTGNETLAVPAAEARRCEYRGCPSQQPRIATLA